MSPAAELGEETSFPSLALLSWFKREARPLPWRENYDPYQVALSEMMCQQTQIATALPYFQRWVARWPDWSSLALAEESEVLSAWEGLGYYQRARRLLALAKRLHRDHGGFLPKEREALFDLPGLGPYTVAAIRTIAFNLVDFPIDGNVRRVLSRFYGDRSISPSKQQDQCFSDKMLPQFRRVRRRRELAQALMELGAMVCRPKKALCQSCPIQRDCYSATPIRAQGFPIKKAKAKAKVLHLSFVWIPESGGVWLRQRPPKGRFPSQYEAPNVEASTEAESKGKLCEALLVPVAEVQWEKPLRRDFTTYQVTWHEGVLLNSMGFDAETRLREQGFENHSFDHVERLNLIPLLAKRFKSQNFQKPASLLHD